jgi:hypothetical protein
MSRHSTPRAPMSASDAPRPSELARPVADPISGRFEWRTTTTGTTAAAAGTGDDAGLNSNATAPSGRSIEQRIGAIMRKRTLKTTDDDAVEDGERAERVKGASGAWGRGRKRANSNATPTLETPPYSSSLDAKGGSTMTTLTKSDGGSDGGDVGGGVESRAIGSGLSGSRAAELHRSAVDQKRVADTLRAKRKAQREPVDWTVLEAYMNAAIGFVEATGALSAANGEASEIKRVRYAENAKFCEFVAGVCDSAAHKSTTAGARVQAAACSALVMRMSMACRRRVVCMSEAALNEATRNASVERLVAGVNDSLAFFKTQRDASSKMTKLKKFCYPGDDLAAEFEGGDELYHAVLECAPDAGAEMTSTELVDAVRLVVDSLGALEAS